MNGTDVIRNSLETGKNWVLGLVNDMKDAPTTFPTPNGGNHPLWVVGHLLFAEGHLIDVFIQGKEHPTAQWNDLFGIGSEPTADASAYPSLEELLGKWEETRARTLAYLDTLSDDDLDKPSHAPAEAQDTFGTVGKCLITLSLHFTFHGGQVADARRAARREPLLA